jgi:DNA-directed RNA polymerase specialized sigma24 family protein
MTRRKIDVERALALRREGHSLDEVAAYFAVSGASAVRHAIKRHEAKYGPTDYHGHDEPRMAARRAQASYAAGSRNCLLSPDQLAEVFRLYHVDLLSMAEIGGKFSSHERTIGRYLNGVVHRKIVDPLLAHYGKPDRARFRPPARFTRLHFEQVFRLYHEEGKTIPQVANFLGMSNDTVYSILEGQDRYAELVEDLKRQFGGVRARNIIDISEVPIVFELYWADHRSQASIGVAFDTSGTVIGHVLRNEIRALESAAGPLYEKYGPPEELDVALGKEERYILTILREALRPRDVVGDRQRRQQPPWLEGQRFDVWVPDLNLAVEYHGVQHFEAVECWGGADKLKERQLNDERKREKCRKHGVTLIEFTYKDLISRESVLARLTSHRTLS